MTSSIGGFGRHQASFDGSESLKEILQMTQNDYFGLFSATSVLREF
jgi:hypothetical protein